MAEDVTIALKIVFQKIGGLSLKESETLLAKLKEEKRFHEDIFGITYRAPEIINTEIATSGPALFRAEVVINVGAMVAAQLRTPRAERSLAKYRLETSPRTIFLK